MDLHPTDIATADTNTLLSPGFRVDVLEHPEHQRQRAAIEAALFGSAEAVSVGRFRLLQRLGQGGMGTVHAAYDDRLDRKIAVKLILASRLADADVRERTLREARALARVSHPNVVHVYEVGEIETQLFVAMEFLAGPTLRAWLDAQPRSWREILQLYLQAGEGLAAAHAQGIIHRDFKPHNAMLGADGRVRVLDFGLARVLEFEAARPEDSTALDDGVLTMTGVLLGTPAYMAPEQWEARELSAQTDQFSFCVALFEALYGHRPFAGETISRLRENVTTGKVAARPRDTDVPRWVHAVLLRGLSVEPAARWPSMRELLASLGRDPEVRRRRVAFGTLLLAAAGAVIFAVNRPSEPAAEIEVCADARDQITEVWDEARAASVEQTVRAKHHARADEALAITFPQIERYANDWSNMRDEACRTHAQGLQSENVFDLRTACLDQRLASLDTLVHLLATADAKQLDGIVQAAAGLPAIERCGDTTALLAAIAPPDDPSLEARVQEHRKTLARVRVHEEAGQLTVGHELVTKVLSDEDALGYEPLLAEAYLRKGAIELNIDPPMAEHSLARALSAALATGHAVVAAQASSKQGYLYAVLLSQHQRVEDNMPIIMALNRRVEEDATIYAEYLEETGAIYTNLGDRAEAQRRYEQAWDLRVNRIQRRDWRYLKAQSNLGFVASQEFRYADAVEIHSKVIREAEALLGPSHIATFKLSSNLVSALCSAGRLRAALAEIQKLLRRLDSVESSFERGKFFLYAGLVEREHGDLKMCREYYNKAVAISPAGGDLFLVGQQGLMDCAADEGDKLTVREIWRSMAAQIEARPAADPALGINLRVFYGEALRRAGAIEEAIAELEQLRPLIIRDSPPSISDLERTWELALALGKAYRAFGDHDAAYRELGHALAQLRSLYQTETPRHAEALYELGELALSRQRWDEARTNLEQAEAIYVATAAEPDYRPLVRTREALSRARAGK
jgi:tRNA A-37 threonylcarbamoyl transferase component Bud32/tetratricopeptide (TPR) repeat protein